MQNDIISRLQKHYPDSQIRLIGAGWSSDAFETGNKIIRVPKAGTEQYEKEVLILDFLQGRLPVQIPHPKLVKEHDFIFAEHIKITGNAWNIASYEALSEKNQDIFASDIAHFFAVLHAIPVDEIYRHIPKNRLEPYALDDLSCFKQALKSDFDEADIVMLYNASKQILALSSFPVLVHKDFWKSNVLVDDNHRLSGVFDWANACIGNREWDFKTLYHATYLPLLEKILNFYKQETAYHITIHDIQMLKSADSLLCVQYFIQNPHLKDTMPTEWQKSLNQVRAALSQIKNKI